MSLLLAVLLAAQAPIVVTAPEDQKAKKPKQVCELMEVTGSRARHRVCHDQNGYFDPPPGVSNFGGAKLRATHENGVSGAPMGTVPSG